MKQNSIMMSENLKKNRNKKVSLAKNKIDINVSQLGSVYALSELGSDMNLIIKS